MTHRVVLMSAILSTTYCTNMF